MRSSYFERSTEVVRVSTIRVLGAAAVIFVFRSYRIPFTLTFFRVRKRFFKLYVRLFLLFRFSPSANRLLFLFFGVLPAELTAGSIDIAAQSTADCGRNARVFQKLLEALHRLAAAGF